MELLNSIFIFITLRRFVYVFDGKCKKVLYDMVIQCLILEGLVLTLKVALIVAEKLYIIYYEIIYYMRRDRMCLLMSSFRTGPGPVS